MIEDWGLGWGARGVFFPSQETSRAPQPNPQSSLTPKKLLNSDLQFLYVFLYCIIFWLNKNELNWTESRIRTLRLFYFGDVSLCTGAYRRPLCPAFFIKSSFFQASTKSSHIELFYWMETLLASSSQPMAIFAFDFVGNTHTEALMSLLSKSLTQATSYLVAVHLHDRCPSSIPTSKISHVTENGCWLWVKDNCNHLCFVCPRQRRHFLVNNCS